MRFAYARRGGPLLDWSGSTPPQQSRAGETRSLGEFYPTSRNSSALRRYGIKDWDRPYNPVTGGQAISYEHNRALGDLHIPRPGAPEIVSGYESPEPGAATIHLGGYMPEGAVRNYGQQMLGADPVKPAFDTGLIRKASALAAGYHGVKRNNGSIFWGVIWAAAAFISPFQGVLVPLFGAAQGFGQARAKSNPAGRKTKRKTRIGVSPWRHGDPLRAGVAAPRIIRKKRKRFSRAITRRRTVRL